MIFDEYSCTRKKFPIETNMKEMNPAFLAKSELQHQGSSKLIARFGFPQCGDDRTICSSRMFFEVNLYFLTPKKLG